MKSERERPWMASAVFCGNVPCPKMFHRTNCPAWESLLGKSQLSYRCSCLCPLSLCTYPQTTLKGPFPSKIISFVCTHWETMMQGFPTMGSPLSQIYPPPSSVCVNSSGETDKTGRLKEAMEDELVRVWHWPWQRECIGWSICSPSFQQSLVTLASPLLTSVLASILIGHRWSQTLWSPGAAASTEALWVLPPEALSITIPSSLGMTFEAGPQILFPNLKVWTFWRLITLFFPPSCTIYQTTKNWNQYETELPVKTSPLSPKGIRDIFLWTAKTL